MGKEGTPVRSAASGREGGYPNQACSHGRGRVGTTVRPAVEGREDTPIRSAATGGGGWVQQSGLQWKGGRIPQSGLQPRKGEGGYNSQACSGEGGGTPRSCPRVPPSLENITTTKDDNFPFSQNFLQKNSMKLKEFWSAEAHGALHETVNE